MTALCSSLLCFDFQGMRSFRTKWNNWVALTSIQAVSPRIWKPLETGVILKLCDVTYRG